MFIAAMPLEMNSSVSQRNISTINGLCKRKHNVTVYTSYLSKSHPLYTDVNLERTAKVIRINAGKGKELSAKAGRNKFLKKIKLWVYKLWNNWMIYDSWKAIINSRIWDEIDKSAYDVLISSSDPKSSHLIAEKVFDQTGVRWIQIWGDPFTGDITSSGKNENKKKTEEERFFSKAEKVMFLSELTCSEMKVKYPDYKLKFFFMPRPYLEKKIFGDRTEKEKLVLSYCGDYNSMVRNIMPLYTAVTKTGDELTICGDSDLELIEESNIKVFPRVLQEKVEELENSSDVLIHLSNIKGSQVPGKIYNYSATDKPILFILDGETEKLRESFFKYDRYVFCNNTVEDIMAKLNMVRKNQCNVELKPVEDFFVDNVIFSLLS